MFCIIIVMHNIVSYNVMSIVHNFTNGLFHLISIHPLWMTANEYPGGYFEACPGGKTLILMKGRGVF